MSKLIGSGITAVTIGVNTNFIGRTVTNFTLIPSTDVGVSINGGAPQLIKAKEVLFYPDEVNKVTLSVQTEVRWMGIGK